jgi:hypothetical protein
MSEFSNKFLTPEVAETKTEVSVTQVKPEIAKAEEVKIENITPEPVIQGNTEIPDHYKKFEEWSGGKYKVSNDEEAKKFFEDNSKILTEHKELKSKKEWFDEVEKYIGENKENLNPILQFESKLGEGSYKKAMVAAELAKIGDKNIALELVSNDLDSVGDLELLTKFAQFESQYARKNQDAALRSALKSAGIQVSKEDDLKEVIENLDDDDRIMIESKAREKRSVLKNAIDNVQLPEYIDPITKYKNDYEQKQTKTAELKGKWDETMISLKGSLDKISFKEVDFEFEIPEADKVILNDFIRVASQQGREPNDAQKAEVIQRAKDAIFDKHRTEIMKSYKAKIENDVKKQKDAEHHNLSPLTTEKVIFTDAKSEEASSALRKQMGLKN